MHASKIHGVVNSLGTTFCITTLKGLLQVNFLEAEEVLLLLPSLDSSFPSLFRPVTTPAAYGK